MIGLKLDMFQLNIQAKFMQSVLYSITVADAATVPFLKSTFEFLLLVMSW